MKLKILASLLGIFFFLSSIQSLYAKEKMPPNVSPEAHRWLKKYIPKGLSKLIQTSHGHMDRKHVFMVKGLGNWGAGRGRHRHQGNDFVLDLPHKGKKARLYVASLTAGKIVEVKPHWGAYGNVVFVYRDKKPQFVMLYAHLDKILVQKGDRVAQGDRLGLFGCTGNCRKLKGAWLQHQVHIEAYAMPDHFKASDIRWEYLPMGQIRKKAIHNTRTHGIDLGFYSGSFHLQYIDRQALKKKYLRNKSKGGLDAYLKHKL